MKQVFISYLSACFQFDPHEDICYSNLVDHLKHSIFEGIATNDSNTELLANFEQHKKSGSIFPCSFVNRRLQRKPKAGSCTQ